MALLTAFGEFDCGKFRTSCAKPRLKPREDDHLLSISRENRAAWSVH